MNCWLVSDTEHRFEPDALLLDKATYNRGGASEASVATLTDCFAGNFDGTCVKPRGYALEARAMQITSEATRMRSKFAAALQFERLQSLCRL